MKREDFDSDDDYLKYRSKRNISNKKYYTKPEVKLKKAIYKKQYDSKEENITKRKAYGKKIRATSKYKLRLKKWVDVNKEHIKEYRRTPKYKIMKKKYDKDYYDKNNDGDYRIKERERLKIFRLKNVDKIKLYKTKYLQSPKGKINSTYHNQRRIALLRDIESQISNKNIKKIFDRDVNCVYCNSTKKLEIDHIVPISSGGDSLMNNLVISCKKCNCSKQSRDVVDWCYIKSIPLPPIVRKFIIARKSKIRPFLIATI